MEFVSSCHSNVFSPEPIRIKLNWSLFHSVSWSGNAKMWQWREPLREWETYLVTKYQDHLDVPLCNSTNLRRPHSSPRLHTRPKSSRSSSGDENWAWLSDGEEVCETRHTLSLANFTNNWLRVNRRCLLTFLLFTGWHVIVLRHSTRLVLAPSSIPMPDELYQNMSILIEPGKVPTTTTMKKRRLTTKSK